MSDEYRTLFTGVLKQESALSVGGNDADFALVDSPLSRDGAGRFILRGQTIAGALVSTARKLEPRIPKDISARLFDGADDPAGPSRWRFFNSHSDGTPEFRQHVGIRQDTGAAAEGVLYDVEVLPRGAEWPFLLEVNTRGEGGAAAERLAAAALLEWARGRCFLGRDVARGLGWLTLTQLEARRLKKSDALGWPDSTKRDPFEYAKTFGKIPDQFATAFGALPVSRRWLYLDLEGTICAGARGDGYGLDALSIGGHALAEAVEWSDHLLFPRGRIKAALRENFKPDRAFAMTRHVGGALEPFLPGSSLRGPLRHALSRALRHRNWPVRDPNVDPKNDDKVRDLAAALFGSFARSARILVRDAHLDGAWKAAWLQHHAEDEFARGVFRDSKFDKLVLVEGTFRWRVVFESPVSRLSAGTVLEDLRRVFEALGAAGHLPLGGAKWRSAGWPQWTVKSTRRAWAGEDGNVL